MVISSFSVDISETGRIIMLVIGVLGTLLGFIKLLVEVVLKPFNAYKEQTKRESEERSHEPLFIEIRKLTGMFENFNTDIEKMEKTQRINSKTSILTAKALLSLVTDLSVKGEPNGKTEHDTMLLRDHIYSMQDLQEEQN